MRRIFSFALPLIFAACSSVPAKLSPPASPVAPHVPAKAGEPALPLPTGAVMGPNGVSVLAAHSPDYRTLIPVRPPVLDWVPNRPPSARPPADARTEIDRWIALLEPRGLLSGAGLAPPQLDIAMTAEDFDALVARERWAPPPWIRYNFVEPLRHEAVAEGLKSLIRLWPASPARSGAGNEAAFRGRILLKDGCFVTVDSAGREELAWFPAEVGLTLDSQGYMVLIDRRSGTVQGRIGEEYMWAGPNGLRSGVDDTEPLKAACGNRPIHVLSMPSAMEKMYLTYPHLREDGPGTPD